MCGRFASKTPPEKLQRVFHLKGVSAAMPPRYNIAPTQPVPAVLNDGRRILEPLHWGLVPFWSKDAKGGAKMINARVETLESKPAFKEAFGLRRCVVLADGFYEWRTVGGRKVPYFIHRKDGEPFAFAGLWDRWRKGEETLRSCTVITIPPVGLFKELHDRMPAILNAKEIDTWLTPGAIDPAKLHPLLVAPPVEEWEAYPVSTLVNKPDYDAADLLERAPEPEPGPKQLSLID
jgi:putative SOS response-associated peptidase YedK